MIYSGETNNNDLVSDVRWLISGSATGATDYAIKDITRNINRKYDEVVSLIMKADNSWEWDDENYTTLPVATTNLVISQADYNISSGTFLNLIRLELKDSSGNWTQLTPISYEDKKGVAMTEWAKTDGTPLYYDKVGNSFILYPTPNYSSTAGLRAYYQRIPSYFEYGDTDKEAGFAPIFHRILSLGAARDYCILNGLNTKMSILRDEITKMQASLVDYYSSRNKDDTPKITLYNEGYDTNDNSSGDISFN